MKGSAKDMNSGKNFYPGAMNVIDVDQLPRLVRIMKRQNGNQFTPNGKPVKIFAADGFLSVQYENGQWFHYDLDGDTWF